jgi:hypothetical protein
MISDLILRPPSWAAVSKDGSYRGRGGSHPSRCAAKMGAPEVKVWNVVDALFLKIHTKE